jgi:hypothetical protein
MNNIIKIIKLLLIFVNSIFLMLFIFNYKSFAFDFITSINFILLAITTYILFFIESKNIFKKNIVNSKYDIAFISSQLIILFIILRNMFDPNLFLNFNNFQLFSDESSNINSFFLINNYFYINILNLCLIIILYVNKEKID